MLAAYISTVSCHQLTDHVTTATCSVAATLCHFTTLSQSVNQSLNPFNVH